MVANEEILRLAQAGLESTRGTGVAATRKVYAQISPSYERAIREFADTSGSFAARRRLAYQRQRATFAVTELLTFEDWAWWLQLAVKGGVTGVADGGTPPGYLYTFTPSLATDDLKSMTLEWNHVGNAYKSTQVMVNSWTVRIDPDNEGGWMLDADLLARDLATASYTGSITDRGTEVVKAPTTKLYIDDATIGTTQITAKLISASVTGNNNIHFKAFAEDESAFAADKVGRGQRTYNAQLVLEFDDDAEFAKYRAAAGTKRYVRLKSDGTQIHGSPATPKYAQIDMNGYWESISWGNREGNIIATFGLSCFYDATSGYDAKFTVLNDLATLP